MEPADRRQVEEDAAYTEELLQQVSIEQRESPKKKSGGKISPLTEDKRCTSGNLHRE